MTAKERINETVSNVMDEMNDLFWTIREHYDKEITPEQFAQEAFAQFQIKLDKLKDDLNDEVYDDEEAEYTPCDDCYHPYACAWCEYHRKEMIYMGEFNYKNAYRLAVQTNRELHASIEAYKTLLDAAKAELAKCYEQIHQLEHEKEDPAHV